MATNRYGQIWHGDHHHIDIRFPSTEARLKFQNEFEAYHASHDHEGDIPIFKNVVSKDLKLSTGSRSPEDLIKAETDKDYRITIDGYGWNDIHEYHNPSGWRSYFWYHVPTCCVPPVIVIDREFVDSGTLKRHSLSAIFGDMPADDFQSLLESVDRDGFIDPIVRIHEGQILDGWHRYRAAQELNLIRRLKFQEWREDEKKDGDPRAFVLARNLHNRHLTPQQRAQIVVKLYYRNVDTLRHKNGVRCKPVIAGEGSTFKPLEELLKKKGQGLEGTYSSYVYFIGAFDWKTGTLEAIKIGKSNNPPSRLKELQTATPHKLTLLGALGCSTEKQALDFEEYFLRRYSKLKIHGDWVKASEALLSYINELVGSWDITETIRISAVLDASEERKARESENRSEGSDV